jgi:DNA-3-methyladenine glycosylase
MRLDRSFFCRDALLVAPELLGKALVRKGQEGISSHTISEVEVYLGIEDQASHARFGKTTRNAVMFDQGGLIYVYLIYGMHWMLNIVTGQNNQPQAILIRGITGFEGPGKITRALHIDQTFYGENLASSGRIWVEEQNLKPEITRVPRFGIDYAKEPWKSMPWRYIMAPQARNS